MPEYLAPGVFVEETSFRQKTIEGVGTSTAAFVGPTRFGPSRGAPELLAGFGDFERIYGGLDQLEFGAEGAPTDEVHNFMAHAVRAFFENGGKRLYVARTANGTDPAGAAVVTPAGDGQPDPPESVRFAARYPGRAGNFSVSVDIVVGPQGLQTTNGVHRIQGAREYDLVWVDGTLFWLEDAFDDDASVWTYRLRTSDPDDDASAEGLVTGLDGDESVHLITANVTVGRLGRFMDEQTWTGLALHPQHTNALTTVFAADPPFRATELYVPLVVDTDLANGVSIAQVLLSAPVRPEVVADRELDAGTTLADTMTSFAAPTDESFPREIAIRLTGGSDGEAPTSAAYEGDEDAAGDKSGLLAIGDLSDVSMVAAPGSTAGYGALEADGQADVLTTQSLLIGHAERLRYRIAVLDAPDHQVVSDMVAYRGRFDSTHAALYYPWVTVFDPITRSEQDLPPSGFVTGIYARNDVERGVHKAPANEVVRLAVGFEVPINTAQQDVLNPQGVNCFRAMEGRGLRLWGARTITSDPEWKYVNLRRYFAFLESSIDRGTQWAVFEPNGERLWANVKRTVEDFLANEFVSGHLLGTKPEESYFVRCDRTTMTQNDIDNGRLVCLIGVAPLRPAEFVIFRIGQKTLETL